MSLKLIILAIIFVLTSGAFFTDYFKKHKFLTILAAIMAIISSFFLLQDIYDIKDDQQKSLEAQLEQERQEKAALQAQLEALKKKNESMPGTVFTDRLADGSKGPEMVWISFADIWLTSYPAGTFRMGDIQGGGSSNEQPVHEVSVGKFAMGKYEVTVAEFRKFVNAKNYKTDAEKQGSCYSWSQGWKWVKGANWRSPGFSQNDKHPVTCVSWNDATAYAKWLSDQTGKQYRLPTEAEWEYAARAGTETKYWWGNDIGNNHAVCDGCGSKWDNNSTAPVGSFTANKFGLYDTSGNVWEWTCSEYTDKYTGKEKECINNNTNKKLVLRGGSWGNIPANLRTARRNRVTPGNRNVFYGFRVVVLRAAWTN